MRINQTAPYSLSKLAKEEVVSGGEAAAANVQCWGKVFAFTWTHTTLEVVKYWQIGK